MIAKLINSSAMPLSIVYLANADSSDALWIFAGLLGFPILVSAVMARDRGVSLLLLPFAFVCMSLLSVVSYALWLQAAWLELIKKDKLTVWVKGH
jgi:hypothetical protein